MLTYGFYNSVNKDRRYDAEQIGALFDGLINDGIYANYKEAMKIVPGSGKRQIVIRPGRAWFNGTWTLVDDNGHSFYIMSSQVETTYYIYLYVGKNDRRNSISWYSEVQENKPETGEFFYLMGQVTIPAGVNAITEDMIVDLRGSSHCPFVTGILETADFERIVRETCEENWLLWLNSYEEGLNAKVAQIQATADKANTSADLAIATVQNLRHLAYRWAKYNAILVQGGSVSWVLTTDILDSGGEPPKRVLYREFTFDGVNCTLSDPVSTTGISAADQYANYRSAPYFYGDGYGGTVVGNVYRYDRMTENLKASSSSVTITYGYRVSCAKIVEGTYEPGAYIGTVEAQYASEYPLDGYKDGYWYTRFASRASDVFFDNTGLSLSARNVQEAIEALYKTGGNGNVPSTSPSHVEVDTLPDTGIYGVIYVVKNHDGGDSDEYIWVDRWEKLGGGHATVENVSSVYKGKRMSILGDSISTFIGWIPSGNAVFYTGNNCGVSVVNDVWWKKLLDALGATLVVNESWSGSRVTTTNGNNSAGCVRCENLGEDPDVVIVYLGINDFNNEVALGTYDGNGTFPTNTNTFREAYAVMLDKILTKYKTAEVWVCTLPYCERNGDLTFPEKNANSVLLNDFNDAIRELADLFGVRVLEHAKCGMNYHNMSEYMGDYSAGAGLHPNAYGHSLIANNDIWQMDPAARTRYAISEAPDAVTLVSISAVYSGGPVTVGTDVATLTGVAVTAHYSDGSSTSVTGYTLSGTIAEGDNVITVSYEGLTATVSVPGVAAYMEYTLDDIAVVNGSMGAAISGEITCDTGRSTDRRTYWIRNGEKPVLIKGEPSEYFPFPIPDSANTARVSVNASTQVLGIMLYTLSDNVYNTLKDIGWVNSNETTQAIPTGTNRYMCIGAKCSDNGAFEETDEATAMTVRFY